jgi:hypothetical protein
VSRTFIKLHGAWSGRPFYVEASDVCTVGQHPEDLSEASDVCTVGQHPEDLSETWVCTYSGLRAVAIETPDEVMHLMASDADTFIVSDKDYDTKAAERLGEISKRAEAKIARLVDAAIKHAEAKENA